MITVTISQHPCERARTYTVTTGDDGFSQYTVQTLLKPGATWDKQEPRVIAGIMACYGAESIDELDLVRLDPPKLSVVPPAS